MLSCSFQNDLSLESLSSWRIQSELGPPNKCDAEGMIAFLWMETITLSSRFLLKRYIFPTTELDMHPHLWMLDCSSYRLKVSSPPHLSFWCPQLECGLIWKKNTVPILIITCCCPFKTFFLMMTKKLRSEDWALTAESCLIQSSSNCSSTQVHTYHFQFFTDSCWCDITIIFNNINDQLTFLSDEMCGLPDLRVSITSPKSLKILINW